jgi:anti-sigma regulatory factor (Ser/Thr protein kinase)
MSNLYIPNSIALRNFDSLFKSNNYDFADNDVAIGFHPTYVAMHPIGLAFYAALADRFRTEGVRTSASINFKIRSIPYLQRMGLFRIFGFEDPVPINEHEEVGRFIPLMKISDSAQLSAFIKTVDPILHTTRDNSRVIKHVFSELLRNVIEHSHAPLGGNVCATYNRKKAKISIGISDAGIGILESMKYHHHLANHREALRAALMPGLSGTTSRIGGTAENAGAGLFFTKCIAQSTRNHFLIYSGNSYFKLNLTPAGQEIVFNPDPETDYKSVRDSLPNFQGTLIGIDVNIEDTKAFTNLIDKIGTAYQLNVKQTKKDYYSRIRFT